MIKYQLLSEGAQAPVRRTDGAAGYDLYAAEDTAVWPYNDIENSGLPMLIGTGVSLEIPQGWVGLIRDRSGNAVNQGLVVVAGVIDSDYRGEVMVAVHNLTSLVKPVAKGDRIAQILFVPCYMGELVEADLSETERGANGFGSTGA